MTNSGGATSQLCEYSEIYSVSLEMFATQQLLQKDEHVKSDTSIIH